MATITLKVNNVVRRVEVEDNEILLDVLREKLHVKSVKAACWRGECGLCTVMLNGKPVKSCLVLAVEADGSEIVTAEGLSGRPGELAPIQKAFIEHAALQCGFCTPAFVVVAHYLLTKTRGKVEREEVKEYLSGLICRCTGYKQIIDAVMDARKHYGGEG